MNCCCISLIASEDEQQQVKSSSNNHIKGTASVCVLDDDDDDAQLSCIENGGISEENMSSEAIDDNGESLILTAKSTLKIHEFKQFQIDCITAVKQGKDVIVV